MKTPPPAAVMAFALGLATTLPVHAASFDCTKARTGTEKAICADHTLNDEDVQMVDWLAAIAPFEAMGATAERRDQQRAWLAQRNRCGADRTCLGRLYQRRVGDLKDDFQHYAGQYGPLGPGPGTGR